MTERRLGQNSCDYGLIPQKIKTVFYMFCSKGNSKSTNLFKFKVPHNCQKKIEELSVDQKRNKTRCVCSYLKLSCFEDPIHESKT